MRAARVGAAAKVGGGMVKPRRPQTSRAQHTRGGNNHQLQQLLSGARIGSRDAQPERDAHARAPAIADSLSSLARMPRPGGGAALPQEVASDVGAKLGADLSHVRLHDDEHAAGLARGANARAFTHGGNIAFGRGQFDPSSAAGRTLIAHELVHAASPSNEVQREPDGPQGVVRMHFNGDDLIVYDGETEKFRFSAQSGHPTFVSPEDIKECGGDPKTDTYLNNKRYVGIKNKGPIPEGTYRLSPRKIQTWGLWDQLRIMTTSHSDLVTVPAGTLSGGDWGEGRVPLEPMKIESSECGNTKKRDSFFLHGGWAGGSSGCIDIGTSFSTVADWLKGYKGTVTVTVKYENTPPNVRIGTGLTGALAYGGFKLGVDTSLGLGTELQGESKRFYAAPQIDGVLKWAGGALRAGVRLELPVNDKEHFVRLGLQGGLESRLFGALYAHIYGGYSFPLTDEATTAKGGYFGGGLKYDLGRVELGLMYDHLWNAKQASPDVDHALLLLGIKLP